MSQQDEEGDAAFQLEVRRRGLHLHGDTIIPTSADIPAEVAFKAVYSVLEWWLFPAERY